MDKMGALVRGDQQQAPAGCNTSDYFKFIMLLFGSNVQNSPFIHNVMSFNKDACTSCDLQIIQIT